MPKKTVAAVKRYENRLRALTRQIAKVYHEVLPWTEKREGRIVDPMAADSIAALGTACFHLEEANKAVLKIHPEWVPPRAPPVRKYRGLKVGDYVVVGERYRERSPLQVRTSKLRVVEDDGDILSVEIVDGVIPGRLWGLERRVLVAAPKPAEVAA